jgi:DNA-binding MarR family transcriptional regulator
VDKRLAAAIRLIEVFRQIEPNMQLQTAATFLYIAQRDLKGDYPSLIKLGNDLASSNSTASRNVLLLSETFVKDKSGHGLVESFDDPMDRRKKVVRLTPKGHLFLDKIRGAVPSPVKPATS